MERIRTKLTQTCRYCGLEFRDFRQNRGLCSLECKLLEGIVIGSEDECWPWLRAKLSAGYGTLRRKSKNRIKSKPELAHRLVLEYSLGKLIPRGLQALHSCDHPWCCNPDHLQLGTQRENIADCIGRGRFNMLKKIGDNEVLAIRANAQNLTRKQLSIRYGCRPNYISRIRGFRARQHVGHVPIAKTVTG